MKRIFAVTAVGFCMALAARGLDAPVELIPHQKGDQNVAATIVVYNERDLFSAALAQFYAEKRGIPPARIVALNCSMAEEISRQEYNETIAEPLRKIFTERGWWTLSANGKTRVEENHVRFVALMRGIPLKIRQEPNYPGDVPSPIPVMANVNQASVDSELAVLGSFIHAISGGLGNPYYRAFSTILSAKIPALMLVCRLDGPSDAIVRRMLEDSIETEKTGLWGFAYINERAINTGGLAMGDEWLQRLMQDAMRHGIPCILEKGPALFSEDYPMRNVALYYGWYSGSVQGPFARKDFRFNKGAVAYHLHSYSAGTLRDENANWAAPLLARGAAATMGNVYEPYLPFTPHLDIFNERLRNGFTFAESAYMSEDVLSWQTTFVGDPLYRPFKLNRDFLADPPSSAEEWVAYRDGAQLWFDTGRATGESALRRSGNTLRSGVISKGLGLLEAGVGDLPASIKAFDTAKKFYRSSDDILRVTLHAVRFLRTAGKNTEALALVAQAVHDFPNSSALRVLRSEFTPRGP